MKIFILTTLLVTSAVIANTSYAQVPGQVLVDAPTKVVAPTPPDNAAPGSDPALVWVNKNSQVYLCPTDVWYGKTRNGEYMSEWNAKALNYHAKYNKACGP